MWTRVGDEDFELLATVPDGDEPTVMPELKWPSHQVPPSGHYCFVALAGREDHPPPRPEALTTWAQFVSLVRSDPTVTWRNFNVIGNGTMGGGGGGGAAIPGQGAPIVMEFEAPGAFDAHRVMQLEVLPRLPPGSRLRLEIPLSFFGPGRRMFRGMRVDAESRVAIAEINPRHRRRFERIRFVKNSRTKMRLVARIPNRRGGRPYSVVVRQLWRGKEVGRVTWRLVPPI